MAPSSDKAWRQDRIRLTLPNDMAHVRIARSAVRAAARPYGYSTTQLDDWETVIEEAMSNVVRFAYGPGEQASFDIDCLQQANGLSVRIRDRGRPFDPHRIQPVAFGGDARAMPERGLGWHLMERLMDVVTLESLGREGKQLILFKAAPHQLEVARLPAPRAREPGPSGAEQATIRKATADDVIDVIRLIYECYRYSYFNDRVYSPEALGKMIVSGEIDSYVAELPGGRLVAHVALIHYPDRPAAVEYGMAATDPAYRGNGVLNRLMTALTEQAIRSGKSVRFGGAVTAHVASQKAALRSGFNESGLMLGAVPPEDFEGLDIKAQGRGTILFLSALLKDRTAPRIVLPRRHEAFITRLYERCRIPFLHGEAGPPGHDHSDVTISVRPTSGTVRVVVRQIGRDLVERMKAMMHAGRLSRIDVGQLFLPLSDPALPEAVAALEQLGWFVTGMLPEGGPAGDVLLMHWLNSWAVDYDVIAMARDEGRQLLEEVRSLDPENR
jgi:serine/threonine-protein kinase RsbW